MTFSTDGINPTSGVNDHMAEREPTADDYKNLGTLIKKARANSLVDGTVEILIGFIYALMAAEEFIVLNTALTNDHFSYIGLGAMVFLGLPYILWMIHRMKKLGIASQGIRLGLYLIGFLAIIMIGKALDFLYAPLIGYLMLSLAITFSAMLWRGWLYTAWSFIGFFIALQIVQSSPYMSDGVVFYTRPVSMILFFGFMAVVGLISLIHYVRTNDGFGLVSADRVTEDAEGEGAAA